LSRSPDIVTMAVGLTTGDDMSMDPQPPEIPGDTDALGVAAFLLSASMFRHLMERGLIDRAQNHAIIDGALDFGDEVASSVASTTVEAALKLLEIMRLPAGAPG
jgi:hypothetical protein